MKYKIKYVICMIAFLAGLLLPVTRNFPIAGKDCHSIVGTLISESDQIDVQLFDGALLLA